MKTIGRLLLLITVIIFNITATHAQVNVEISDRTITVGQLHFYVHTVQRKQTLYAIAKAYKVDQQTLIDQNPALRTHGLQTKQTLLIPTHTSYLQLQKEQAAKQQPKTVPNQPFVKPTVITPNKVNTVTTQKDPNVTPSSPNDLKTIRTPRNQEPINIAVLLPFSDTQSSMNENSTDFYSGTLLAINKLKEQGIPIQLNLISTGGNVTKTREIIENGTLQDAHLIVGPVYVETFDMVADYARTNNIIIVSPLSTVNQTENPYVVQAPPASDCKYDKLRHILNDPEINTVYIEHDQYPDTAAVRELQSILPTYTRKLAYNRKSTVSAITATLTSDRPNVIIVPVSHQGSVENILSKIASINSLSKHYDLQVIGTSRWKTLPNVNPELFFKTSTSYPSSYYSDRTDPKIEAFYNDYITAFTRIPSLFSLRGYDITMIMVQMMQEYGENTLYEIRNQQIHTPLQMPYQFKQDQDGTKIYNNQWVMVTHTPSYQIILK